MVVIPLLILVFVIIATTDGSLVFTNDIAFQERGFIPPHLCDALVRASSKYTFSKSKEPVDDEPLYQINVMANGKVLNKELWIYCSHIYEDIVKPRIKHACTEEPYFVFVKRYKSGERLELPMHHDQNLFTVSILLTDEREFKGGEFYMLNSRESEYIMKKYPNIKSFEKKNRHLFTKLKYDKGDMLAFEGNKHLHGVLPLKQGERYVLTYFISYVSY